MHGDLKQSQDEARRHSQKFRISNPEWSWRFKILETQSLLWQGMYANVLSLLDSQPAQPHDKDSAIEILAIRGVAHARLHAFPEAEAELAQATQMCQSAMQATCGDVVRARGVLAVQHGQIQRAKQLFEESLQFARTHGDPFLEETSLLNIGLTSMREGHFDEAIDWTDAAYRASLALGANGEAQAAVGNLGWAYYNLGDFEKSLNLTLEAEKHAIQVGDVIDQLYWTTNEGYVYAALGDLARAEASYLKALDLAKGIGGKQGIYNALRALALVSVERGELTDSRRYSSEALAIARADHNREDELFLILVNALDAARSNDSPGAERMFREVERDQHGIASLKWRAEHGLARLYDEENRPDAASREYRAALKTFEGARSSLKQNDSRLPFATNGLSIYDDFIHFLVAQGKPDEALRWADQSRARTLTEGLRLDGSTNGLPQLDSLQLARRARGTILFYWLSAKQSLLWVITPQKANLLSIAPAGEIEAAVLRYRRALGGPVGVLDSADRDGLSLYRMLVAPAQSFLPKKNAKIYVIPDGGLNNLNFETLLVSSPNLHFWIEDVTIANASSLLVLGAPGEKKTIQGRKLLLIGDSVSPNAKFPELPKAAAQMESVAKHFPESREQIVRREQATPQAYAGNHPEQFSYIHFVAHGTASRLSPLDSAIILSKGGAEDDSFKLYARDIIGHPLRANLVMISACNSSGDRSYSGEGLVGLSWAFLRAGAHNVVAALWEVQDAPSPQFMDRFYGELASGAPPDVALRAAKLFLLHGTNFRNPFYWGPFQLYARLD